MKKHRLDDSPPYRKWVLARDKALEHLHANAQAEAADEMRRVLTDVLVLAKSYYHEIKNPLHAGGIDRFETMVKDTLRRFGDDLFRIYTLLKIRSYILASTSETEIIAQHLPGKIIRNEVSHTDLIRKRAENSFAGGPIHQRIQLYLDRMARKIISVAQASALNAKTGDDFLMDVSLAFPPKKFYRRPPRVLKPKTMREADFPIDALDGKGEPIAKADAAMDFMDQGEWKDMVDAYMKDYVPKWRSPEYTIGLPITDPTIQATTGDQVWYAWEFERDMTNEFVSAVRDGQVDAANSAGITDFVWIAVIDNVTDACCRWRDGLLVSEIEKQLSAHQDEDGECNLEGDGLNPPIHFNCRCTLAPATDNIPDKPDDGAKDFDEWLET